MPEALIKFERELSAPNEVFAPDNGILRAASREPDPTLAILSTGPNDQYYLVHKRSGRRLDVVYERIEDRRIYDDLPGLIESQAAGKVEAVFAPNLGIADDKGVYPFILDMIRTYLGEEPIL